MCHSFGPPYGIPIPAEVHDQYAPNVKAAWEKFHTWWQEALSNAEEELVDSSSMPATVRAAYNLINETPIPGRDDGATGADSCYIIGVNAQMT